jgi:hypothetical protein
MQWFEKVYTTEYMLRPGEDTDERVVAARRHESKSWLGHVMGTIATMDRPPQLHALATSPDGRHGVNYREMDVRVREWKQRVQNGDLRVTIEMSVRSDQPLPDVPSFR